MRGIDRFVFQRRYGGGRFDLQSKWSASGFASQPNGKANAEREEHGTKHRR
jgi:hypothetical protein